MTTDDNTRTPDTAHKPSKKSQWLWLIGLWVGGAVFMYGLAKITKLLMQAAGLAP
ncbi:hypothetical protein [Wohlfahrtiimonas sp. G9077]|uniref:hypothetical protein n=1 Tax=Wohlfahrtiimonas sp. G9077 TaxID=1980118 RepID=UPI0018F25032|nr:hypothetical protein [Wohlfahrtiimonas sp. G9077]